MDSFTVHPPLKSVSYNPSSFRFWQKSVKIMSAASFPPSQNSTFGRFGSSCCWSACCSIHSRLGFSRGACGVSANNKLQVANFSQFQLARHCCGSQLHRFFFFLVRFFCTGSFCNFRKCLCLYLEKSCLLTGILCWLLLFMGLCGPLSATITHSSAATEHAKPHTRWYWQHWRVWFLVICQKYGDAVSLKGGRGSHTKVVKVCKSLLLAVLCWFSAWSRGTHCCEGVMRSLCEKDGLLLRGLWELGWGASGWKPMRCQQR